MATYQTTMKADKFKKAVGKLPAASADDTVAFFAFRAPVDGQKDTFKIGLYIGADMKSDYEKDMKAAKAPM